jgi:hypothetical protein
MEVTRMISDWRYYGHKRIRSATGTEHAEWKCGSRRLIKAPLVLHSDRALLRNSSTQVPIQYDIGMMRTRYMAGGRM